MSVARPALLDLSTVNRLRRLARRSVDFIEGVTVAPEPGLTDEERAGRVAYAAGVRDTLHWLADGDVDPTSQLIAVLALDDVAPPAPRRHAVYGVDRVTRIAYCTCGLAMRESEIDEHIANASDA